MNNIITTGVERFFDNDDIIVSKTDIKGRITYANRIFIEISGYTESGLLGQPHSILRHPDMPRCVFKLLWDRVSAGHEIFAYVINRCANGDHYWVFAHVTPTWDDKKNITGYHSNRRVANSSIVNEIIKPLYALLLETENRAPNRKQGMQQSYDLLCSILKEKGCSYDEFIFSLVRGGIEL